MKSPIALVKEKFGEKSKLVEAVQAFVNDDADGGLWVARENKDKGLAHVSNSKLLRLHDIFTAVKEKFGTRAKLIDAILGLEKRTQDAGYKTRLEKHPVPRLYDQYRAASKREAAKNAPKKTPKKTAAAGEAPAKKAAAPAKKAAAKKAAGPGAAKKAAAARKADKKGASKKR